MTAYLTPRVGSRLRSLLDQNSLVEELIGAFGSPLAVVLPEQVTENIAAFREIYGRHQLGGRIYFAHKANQSSAVVRELAAADAAIDVSSLGELQHALGAGISPPNIVTTGPKSPEFLWLAARTGVLVNADSLDELDALAALVTRYGLARRAVIGRLSAFTAPGARVLSRRSHFGIPVSSVSALLDLLEKRSNELDLAGVAFHLDTSSAAEKATALEGCLLALDEAHQRGLRPRSVDIGGGFGVNYLADAAEWESFTTELTNAVLGRRAPLTWNNHGYGLRNEGGKIRGALNLYPAHRPIAGPAYLDHLLSTAAPVMRRPLSTLLQESMYDLHIEPGRALLDQSGVVLARVLHVREEGEGTFVYLDLNADDISMERHGVLMDPIMIDTPETGHDIPLGVFLFGNLCLEADLITRRKVFLPARPRPGDILAFPNAAGYFMDFNATQAARHPAARKVAAYRRGGTWRWCLDENYWPIHRHSEAS